MSKFIKVINHPLVIILFISTGIFCGVFYTEYVRPLSIIGYAYLVLMVFCALPIVILQLVTGVSGLSRVNNYAKILSRLFFTSLFILLVCSFIGLVSGVIGIQFVDMNNTLLTEFDKIIYDSPNISTLFITLKTNTQISTSYLHSISNEKIFFLVIFTVVFISCFIGCIIGLMNASSNGNSEQHTYQPGEKLLTAFRNMYRSLIAFIPLSIFFIASSVFNMNSIKMILMCLPMVISCFIGFIFLLILSVLLISHKTKTKHVFSSIKEIFTSILPVFGTRTYFLFLPEECSSIEKNAKSVSVLRVGYTFSSLIFNGANAFYTCLILCFAIKIYNINLSAGVIILTIFSSALSGLLYGLKIPFANFTSATISLTILGIPAETVICICSVFECIASPMRNVLQLVLLRTSVILSGFLNSTVVDREPAEDFFASLVSFSKSDISDIFSEIIFRDGGTKVDLNNKHSDFAYSIFESRYIWTNTVVDERIISQSCKTVLSIKRKMREMKFNCGISILGFLSKNKASLSFANLSEKYGNIILVNDFIYNSMKDSFCFRIIDRDVIIEDVTISAVYELLAEKDTLGKGLVKLYAYYETGLGYFLTGKYDKVIKYMEFILNYIDDIPAKKLLEKARQQNIVNKT